MSDEIQQAASTALEANASEIQERRRTLTPNQPALERLLAYSRDYFALLLHEADLTARRRGGDGIQSGDVDSAKGVLEGKSKGKYWAVAAGSAALGAGLQGLIEAINSGKGVLLIVIYSVCIVVGLLLLWFGAPRQ